MFCINYIAINNQKIYKDYYRENKMDELKYLSELLKQYDWREVIGIGIGTTIGTGHAIYDKIRGERRKRRVTLVVPTTAITTVFNFDEPIDSFYRNFGNGLLGGVSYIVSYLGVSRLLNALPSSRQSRNFK